MLSFEHANIADWIKDMKRIHCNVEEEFRNIYH